MRVIGLLGGVASGKSLVAGQLAALGAGVLDADREAHAVLCLPEVEAAARERWGPGIFGSDGRIDRARLASIVFADPPAGPEERRHLEQWTHPEIARRVQSQAECLEASGTVAAVLDAPLILEAGWDKLCDMLVFVDAPRPLRLARAKARGWSEREFAAREQVQVPLHSKRARADALVDNSGPPERTQRQVARFWASLVG